MTSTLSSVLSDKHRPVRCRFEPVVDLLVPYWYRWRRWPCPHCYAGEFSGEPAVSGDAEAHRRVEEQRQNRGKVDDTPG